MGESYPGYEKCLRILEVQKLAERRSKLCLTFAKKAETHPKYKNWFVPAEVITPPTMNTRSDKTLVQTKYKPVPTRTEMYRDSPLPFLTGLLNDYHAKK